MKSKQHILNAFRELIYEYNRANKDRDEMMFIDSKMQEKVNKWLLTTLTEFEREVIKDIKKKLPKLQGFEDYEKHVHTGCPNCQLSEEKEQSGWEEELHFEIMEDYILDAEMLNKKDGKKEALMRGHYEKLKSFITKLLKEEREKTKQLLLERMPEKSGNPYYDKALYDITQAIKSVFE